MITSPKLTMESARAMLDESALGVRPEAICLMDFRTQMIYRRVDNPVAPWLTRKMPVLLVPPSIERDDRH
jgi:hypothetical protein